MAKLVKEKVISILIIKITINVEKTWEMYYLCENTLSNSIHELQNETTRNHVIGRKVMQI